MYLLLVFLYLLVIPLSPLIWPAAFAVYVITKKRVSLRSLFIGTTVECMLLGVVVVLYFQQAYEIHFVLPEGFRGGFAIIEDKNGTDLTVKRGAYFVTVPPSRLVRVRSLRPFQNWHSESWECWGKNGDGVAVFGASPKGTPNDAVEIRGLGSESQNGSPVRIKYIYGTEQEAQVGFDAFALPEE